MKIGVLPEETPPAKDSEGCAKNVTLDEAMDKCGFRIQFVYQIFFIFVIGFTFYQSLLSVFAGDSPSRQCRTANSSEFCRQNYGSEIGNADVNNTKRCALGRKEWVYTEPKTYSYVTEFDLVCRRNYLSALIGGSFFIGLVIAAIVCGTISDAYGRKKVFTLFLIFAVLSSISTSFAVNAWMLLASRFVIGLSCNAGWAFSATYLAELIPPKKRAICINSSNFAFPVASLFMCGVAYLVPYWRHLQLYVSLPGILAIFVCVAIPESPYWLISAGRYTEAEQVVRKIARLNGETFEDGATLYRDPNDTNVVKKYTYVNLF